MSFEARLARLLPGKRLRALPLLRLQADASKLLHMRRRGDCARLARCEDDWIAAHGDAQAKCPDMCKAFRAGRGAS